MYQWSSNSATRDDVMIIFDEFHKLQIWKCTCDNTMAIEYKRNNNAGWNRIECGMK